MEFPKSWNGIALQQKCTPFVPLRTSKKLLLKELTIFAIIVLATHALKNELPIP